MEETISDEDELDDAEDDTIVQPNEEQELGVTISRLCVKSPSGV